LPRQLLGNGLRDFVPILAPWKWVAEFAFWTPREQTEISKGETSKILYTTSAHAILRKFLTYE